MKYRMAAMNRKTIAERAWDSTVNHTDRAPNLMNAVPIAVAARNGQNIDDSFVRVESRRGKSESREDHG
jgi:hypothetical protein